jgi:hypothetical protein
MAVLDEVLETLVQAAKGVLDRGPLRALDEAGCPTW